jgi:hypothetical protein
MSSLVDPTEEQRRLLRAMSLAASWAIFELPLR